MVRDCRNSWRSGNIVLLGCALLGGLWSIGLDWDHIWLALGLADPVNFTGMVGRPFHSIFWFAVQSVVAGFVLAALVVRLDSMD